MKRERIDKTKSLELMERVVIPYVDSLGAKYLVDDPHLGEYDHENKTLSWGLGRKPHGGDKRHRTSAKCEGIFYGDGKQIEGKTTTVEINHRVGWSRKIDNRLVKNQVSVSEKIVSFEETFNKLRSFTSLDIMQQFTASAQGEIMGIGGSVSSTSSMQAHTEVETEKFNRTKRERIIDDSTVLDYPGPVLHEDDVFGEGEDGSLLYRKGSVKYPGEVWLVERPVVTLQTITPMTQWGIWDCAKLHLDIYDWAGYSSVLPSGRHKNQIVLNGLGELLDLMKGNLVLQYKWSAKYKPTSAVRAGIKWLENENNRRVGPVEWDRVRLNEDVASLEPSIVTPD